MEFVFCFSEQELNLTPRHPTFVHIQKFRIFACIRFIAHHKYIMI